MQVCSPVNDSQDIQSIPDAIDSWTMPEVSLLGLTLFVNVTGWWNGVPSIPN